MPCSCSPARRALSGSGVARSESPRRAGSRGTRSRPRLLPTIGGMTVEPRDATRIERDSMGEMEVPANALYGASTQRAVLNFPISGERFPREFIRALALIKQAAAETNAELGLLEPAVAVAIG